MSERPIINKFERHIGLIITQYERYTPTAFDESLTLIEKMNKIIYDLNELGKLTNGVVEQWNEVMKWLVNDGLEGYVLETLEKWYEEGKFADLVIQVIESLKEFGVSVKTYGAVGDGVTDDIKAFEKAIASGFPVYVPHGTYGVSRGVRLPSNTVMTGAGVDNSIIKFLDSAELSGDSLIFNDDVRFGNTNIYISDFTADGNVQRFNNINVTGTGGSRDSNITIRASKDVHIDNIKSINAVLHGFDITCGGLDYPYLGDGTTAPNPSSYVSINNCEASNFGDDGITTHHSEFLTISNSFCHDARTRLNNNGIEVDDGSRHVILTNNRSARCYGGVEVKAHGTAPAPYNVVINGHLSVSDVKCFNFRHIGHHGVNDPNSVSAKNIVASNLSAVNPNNKLGFQNGAEAQVLNVSAYYGVIVNNITAYTDEPTFMTDSCITVMFKARNVSISNVVLTGFTNAKNGIYVVGGARGGDSINISNVNLSNTGGYGVSIGSGISNVSITNVSAISTNVKNAAAVVATVNSNPNISGVNGEGYPNICVIAGVEYKEGITLFNGGFRSASTSGGFINEAGAVIATTGSSSAESSKTGVIASSSSSARAERSFIASSSGGETSGSGYNTVLGSGSSHAAGNNSTVIGSRASRATGNASSVIASYGVQSDGSYKVNGGFGDPNSNGNGVTSNKKWELDSLNGDIRASGTITGSATWTDYAEYFESLDGNKISSGTLVSLENGKVRPSLDGEKILGVVSETAGIVLGESSFNWSDKYLKNEFGGLIYEERDFGDGIIESVPKLNPDFDESYNYKSRSDRKEWNVIGLVGQLLIRVDDTVKVGNGIKSKGSIATDGTYGNVMKITTPYVKEKGYGVALVFIK